MTNKEQFEAWWLTKFSAEFLDSDNCHSAWTGWQARGELDAKRIAELEADVKKWQEIAGKYAVYEEQADIKIEALEARNKELVDALEGVTDSLGGSYEQHAIRKRIQDLLGEVR